MSKENTCNVTVRNKKQRPSRSRPHASARASALTLRVPGPGRRPLARFAGPSPSRPTRPGARPALKPRAALAGRIPSIPGPSVQATAVQLLTPRPVFVLCYCLMYQSTL